LNSHSDILGNSISARGDTATAIDHFVGGFLSYETRAARIIDAAIADPEDCLVNTYAGMMWMLLEAPEAPAHAARFLKTAQAAARNANRRERMNLEFLVRWQRGDIPGALAVGDEIAAEFPRDLVIVKLHQYLNFNRGRAPDMLRIAKSVLNAVADVPYIHGMTAFAYEQCHLLDEAEREANKALALLPKEPWAQHALAHVMLTQGRIDEGARFLEEVESTWTDLNSFMITHLWWHRALFYLSQGREADALGIYDAHCWGVEKSYSQDQVGAVSLLARLELAGIDVGGRWHDVAKHLLVRAHDTVEPFLTMQYLYGLAREGKKEADALLAAVKERAANAPPFDREAWDGVALPACEGLLAYARGSYEVTIRKLAVVLPRMAEIGGSHAQRDLFEQILLDATIRAGHWTQAQQMLEMRRRFDPDGVPLNRTLSKVYEALGLPEESAGALARAERTRSGHL
jgi:tetratricopeptide (TPR) repeat protein